MKNIILASQSVRRKELLAKCALPFACISPAVDETTDDGADPAEEVQRLACLKARTVFKDHPEAVVIGSDTAVVIDGKILGKPSDENEAFAMLKKLQGRRHSVMTGLCILSSRRVYTHVAAAEVSFASMSDEEIKDYIKLGESMDKAGAYGIQGYGGRYIFSVSGDYYAVVGLPLNAVYTELKNIGMY